MIFIGFVAIILLAGVVGHDADKEVTAETKYCLCASVNNVNKSDIIYPQEKDADDG